LKKGGLSGEVNALRRSATLEPITSDRPTSCSLGEKGEETSPELVLLSSLLFGEVL
jgi:hypothetical protein